VTGGASGVLGWVGGWVSPFLFKDSTDDEELGNVVGRRGWVHACVRAYVCACVDGWMGVSVSLYRQRIVTRSYAISVSSCVGISLSHTHAHTHTQSHNTKQRRGAWQCVCMA